MMIDARTHALLEESVWMGSIRPRVSTRRDGALRAAWRACVLAMILTSGLLCLALSYRAASDLIAGDWPHAATLACVCAAAGVAAKWLCENRDALVDA